MIRFHCPKCESQMEVDESFAGRPARCPTCGFALRVPKEGEPSTPVAAARRPGAATVRVDGEDVEVVPPLEFMVVVSLGFVVLSFVVFVLIGLVLASFFQYPWTIGAALGAVCAAMGVMIGVPAYHNVRRSRGRKRGRTHALIAMGVGAALFLVMTIVAIAGFARVAWRPTCEENLQRIYTALRAYADKHDGKLPNSLDLLVQQGNLADRSWLTCPAHQVQIGTETYILTPEVDVTNKLWPPDLMIVSDSPPYDAHEDRKVRILLLGGEIQYVPVKEWSLYQKQQATRWKRILDKIRQPKEADPAKPTDAGGGS